PWSGGPLLLIARATEDKAQGRACEAKGLTQPVLQEALVAEMDQLGVVDKKDECRRIGRSLRHIFDLEQPALARQGWMLAQRRLDRGIELGGGDTLLALFLDTQCLLDDLVDALLRFGRDEEHGH